MAGFCFLEPWPFFLPVPRDEGEASDLVLRFDGAGLDVGMPGGRRKICRYEALQYARIPTVPYRTLRYRTRTSVRENVLGGIENSELRDKQ